MHLLIVPRHEIPLRCAYCHDDIEDGKACPSCSTRLHEDCWLLAGLCPTLGCRPPFRILVERVGASGWHLGWWLTSFAAVFAALAGVVPSFDRMFRETGLCLPDLTDALVSVSRFAGSPVGIVVAALVVLASVVAFRRWRSSPRLRQVFVGLTLAGVALFPLGFVALFMPLVQVGQKL